MHRRPWLALLLALIAITPDPLHAQAYPNKPVRLVAPYAAGGPTDSMARLIGTEMAKTLGQPVVVENRPGAAGAVGADAVAKAAPDGYTVCFCTTGPTILMPIMEPKLPYNAARDLAPVGQVHRLELSFLVGPKLAAKNITELIAIARANPGKITYASPGSGSPNHLAGELLVSMAGINLVHVPYKGEQPAMTDLIGGQVDMMVGSIFIGEPQVKAGKLRMIALTGPARAPRFAEIPTVAESLPGFNATSHVGLHVPTGTPKDAIEKLYTAMAAAVSQPQVRERMIAEGITPLGTRPEVYGEYLRRETEKWTKLIQQNGIKLD